MYIRAGFLIPPTMFKSYVLVLSLYHIPESYVHKSAFPTPYVLYTFILQSLMYIRQRLLSSSTLYGDRHFIVLFMYIRELVVLGRLILITYVRSSCNLR